MLAFDPAQRREGEEPDARAGSRCSAWPRPACCCAARSRGERLRGGARRRIAWWSTGTHSGGCCNHDDPYTDGTEAHCEPFPALAAADDEAAWDDLAALLGRLELLPAAAARGLDCEARIDRLGRSLTLVPWVQAELLATRELGTRMRLLGDAARELSTPGSSFRADDLDAPYDGAEHLDDLVRAWDCRARAQMAGGLFEDERHVALVRAAQIRRRRRAAAIATARGQCPDRAAAGGVGAGGRIAGAGAHPRGACAGRR